MKNVMMLLFISLIGFANAQTPFSYSGRLADAGTGKSPTGPTDLIVRVYASGTVLCSKSFAGVPLNKGRFNVTLDFNVTECGGIAFDARLATAVGANQKLEIEVQDVTNGVTFNKTPLGVTPFAMVSLNEGIVADSVVSRKFKGFPVCNANETFDFNAIGEFRCRPTPGLGTVSSVTSGVGINGGTTTTNGTYSLNVGPLDVNYYKRLGPFSFLADFDNAGFKMDAVGTATLPQDMVTQAGVATSIATEGSNYLKDIIVNGNTGTNTLNNGGNLNIIGAISGGVTIATDFNPPASNNLEITISGFGLGTVETVAVGAGMTETGTPIIPVTGLDIAWWDARYVNVNGLNSIMSADLFMGDGTTNYLIRNLLPPLQPLEIADQAYTLGRVSTYAGDITEVVAGDGMAGGAVTGTALLDAVANHGMTIDASTIGVDTALIQRRVSGTCAINSSIREIRIDGTVVCEMDSGAVAGDIEAVNSGGGISVISPGGPAPTVNIDGIYWDNRYMRIDGAFAMAVNGLLDMDSNTLINLDDPIGMTDMSNKQYFDTEIAANAGDVTGMTAGNGLTGTALNGDIDFAVGAGPGIFASADYLSLDVSFLDPFYMIPAGGPLMTGDISMSGTRKMLNVATPTDPNDLANKTYVDTYLDGATNYIDDITAGSGLTGGGVSATVNLDVVGLNGITVNADDIQVTPQGVTNTHISGIAVNCTAAQIMEADGAGDFNCAADDDTTYLVGAGLTMGGNTISLDSALVMVAGVSVAGGDLSGTLPDPTVDGLQTRAVAAGAPTIGDQLEWSGANWDGGADNDTTYSADGATLQMTGTVLSIRNDGLNNSHIGAVLVGADFADGSLVPAEFGAPVINNVNDFNNALCVDGEILKRGVAGWECIDDTNNLYTAGAGLNLAAGVFSIPASGVNSAMIKDGSVFSLEIVDGSVSDVDMDTGYIDQTTDFDNAICADYQIFAKAAGVWGCTTDAVTRTGSAGVDVTLSGPGAAPTSGIVEVDVAWWDTRYVLEAGDTMTGALQVPQLFRTSDRRLKKNIKTHKNALNKFLQLSGVRFDWKKDNSPDIGFIAQEVEEIVPEVVNTNKKGMKSVGYSNLVGLAIEAIKDLKLKLSALLHIKNNSGEHKRALKMVKLKNKLLKKKVSLLNRRLDKQQKIITQLEREI